MARSLSGRSPGSAGGSRLFLARPLALLIGEVALMASSSWRTTLRSEPWTCRLSPTS